MLEYTCSECGKEADGQNFELNFDFERAELYVICPHCGYEEFITMFDKTIKVDKKRSDEKCINTKI
jgi:DNA-directed RNA polymerase subunit RPC12/RpoP